MQQGGAASKTIAAVLCVTMVLSLYSTAIPSVFGLIPANTFSVHSYSWNIVSYIFVEPNPILCACSVGYMLTIGVTVEAAIGTSTFLQLIVVNAIATATVLLVLSALLYQVGFSWFLQCYCGIWPTSAAIIVPWVAFSPMGGAIPLLQPAQLQRQHVPTMLLLFAIIVDWVFRGRRKIGDEDVDSAVIFQGSVFTPAFVGLCVSWALQRLFHPKATVAFQVLLNPVVSRCRACLGVNKQHNDNNNNGGGGGGGAALEGIVSIPVLRSATDVVLLPGSTEEDAERRRSIALAALNSRLQDSAHNDTGRNSTFV